jgi:hypothetical protein
MGNVDKTVVQGGEQQQWRQAGMALGLCNCVHSCGDVFVQWAMSTVLIVGPFALTTMTCGVR